MADPIELLDRQHQRLRERDGAEFVQELRHFYDFITSGPAPVVAALAELREEAAGTERVFEEHDRELIPELVQLRNDLVACVSDIDDSDAPRPAGRGAASMEWAFGLANFDQLATGGPDLVRVNQGLDTSASGMMLRILEQKLRRVQFTAVSADGKLVPSEENQRPELNELTRRLRNLADRHRHAEQDFTQAVQHHGGFQVMYLDVAVSQLNPAPRRVETDEEEHAWMDETFKRVAAGWYDVQDAAAGRPLKERSRQVVDIHVDKLKPAAERVYEDLRMKLATAPPPPEPTPTYWQRLCAWVNSPAFALLGGPCIAGVLTALVIGKGAGLGVFLALAVVLAVVPPLWAHLPTMSYTTSSLAFAGLMVGVVIVLLVEVGLVAAVGAFVLLVLAFALGQRTTLSTS
jgi:hypothetical protein